MRRALSVLLAASLAFGCKAAPPAAAPQPAAIVVPWGPKPGRYVVDPARARFDVYGAGTIAGRYRLRFPEWRAVVVLREDRTAELDVRVVTRSVQVDKTAATGIVKNHLLEVERYPVATLKAKLRPTDASGAYDIDGVADLHGVQQPLRFAGRLRQDPDGYVFHTEVKISRKAFNLRYTPIEPLVKDEVKIVVVALIRAETGAPAEEPPERSPLEDEEPKATP